MQHADVRLRLIPRSARVALLAVVVSGGCPVALGGDLSHLRAELHPLREISDPANPVWLRLTLSNPTDVAIDIPLLYRGGQDGVVALPPEFAFGTPESPALSVGLSEQRMTPIAAAKLTPAETASFLRLGARAAVSVDIDLRNWHRQIVYDGLHRVTWKPRPEIAEARCSILIERRKDAIIVTDYGKLTIALRYDQAPKNVANFLELARSGYYDGKTFHRLVPGFVVQGGCPNGDGGGQRLDGRTTPAEFCDEPVDFGTVLMARKPSDPNSASCQFFLAFNRLPELDGQYTIIGKIKDEESRRTLERLNTLPTTTRDRPMQSLMIRGVRLVNADGATNLPPSSAPAAAAPVRTPP